MFKTVGSDRLVFQVVRHSYSILGAVVQAFVTVVAIRVTSQVRLHKTQQELVRGSYDYATIILRMNYDLPRSMPITLRTYYELVLNYQ